MKYKIGQQVKVNSCESYKPHHGRIGIVVETDRIRKCLGRGWDYKVRFSSDIDDFYLFNAHEIDLITAPNTQLVFEFMKE